MGGVRAPLTVLILFLYHNFLLTFVRVSMLLYFAFMLNYAQVWWESYYAQNYAGIMCQGLPGIHCFAHVPN